MTPRGGGRGLPRWLRRMLAATLPDERRDDILGDLEASLRQRTRGMGPVRSTVLLAREVASLAGWRLRRTFGGAPVPASAAPSSVLRDFAADVRFGARALRRRPGFALGAIAVLGLGIGAPTTVLTLVERIFWARAPEVEEPHRLARVWRAWTTGLSGGSLANPDFEYYRAGATSFEDMAAWGGGLVASYSLDGPDTDQLEGRFVSATFFDVLGVEPAAGRFFSSEENATPGTHPVMVVSEGFRRRALGGDASPVGRTVTVNGTPFTVVGVAPAAFRGVGALEQAPDAWFPIAMFGELTRARDTAWWERLPDSRTSWLSVVGRLAPGVTFEAAEAEVRALSDRLVYENRDETETVALTRETMYSPRQSESLRSLSRMLLAVVVVVLVIATANVAVLLLSRATTRGREISIRAAIGAGRGRIVRQLLAESLVLGLAGGALGIGLAFAFSDAAASLLPYRFSGSFAPDARVLAAAVALAVGTSVLAGLVPALYGASGSPDVDGERVASGRSRVRDALVVGQVALSLVLVAGAALFGRSFWTARTQDLGFEHRDRLLVDVNLRSLDYSEEDGKAFATAGLERLRALPGVTGVTTSRMIPFGGDWSTDVELPPGALPNTDDGKIWVGLNAVSPDYFDVMGVRIVRGRPLGAEDRAGAGPAVVVNETLAGLLWPGQEAVGRTIDFIADRTWTVVGVAEDATYYQLGEEPTTQLYGALEQVWAPDMTFVIRTADDAVDLGPAAREALRALEPRLAFSETTTLDAIVSEQTARYRVTAVLVGLFAALALALAAVGLYGVIAFLVGRRTREIGVRMALGAGRGRIAGEVVRRGLVLSGLGVALGLVGVVWARRLTEGLLYGVAPDDPWAVLAACAVLVTVAAVASGGPAMRATRVDPSEALRSD